MQTRNVLIGIQKKILEGVQAEIRSYVGSVTAQLARYYKDYESDFNSYQRIASKKDLVKDILKSHVVLSGDYHTFVQSQKIPLRLLREVVKKKKNLVIGLEMVMSMHQVVLDQYLLGNVTEEEFLDTIEYERHWGFKWDHFKPIFEFAKKHKLQMLALNCKPKKIINPGADELKHRDKWAADIIAAATVKKEKTLIYVIFGDLHLAKNHLPLAVSKRIKKAKKKRRILTIHQNNEKLYWQLVEKNIEHHVDIVKIRHNVYCVTNAPPWLKLQSYIQWVEKSEHYDQIYQILKVLAKFFALSHQKVTDYHVVTGEKKNYLKYICSQFKHEPRMLKKIKKIVDHSESFFIPGENVIFLKKYSPNHAAEEATILMYAMHRQYRRFPESIEEFFYQNLFLRMVGFLGSKVINPKRKCQVRRHHRVATMAFLKREKRFLEGFKFNASIPQALKGSLWSSYEVSKNLGHLLGEKLFIALHNEYVSHEDVCRLFEVQLKPYAAIEQYLHWLRKLEGIKTQYQSKSDRI